MSRQLGTEKFIEKAQNVHSEKYDYSKVEYVNSQDKVIIICPIHGEFKQSPSKHLYGQGCPECNKGGHYKNIEKVISKLREVHNGKYDYDLSTYTSVKNKMRMICPEHGEFWQDVYAHSIGCGCPKCSNNYKKNTEDFIEDARKIHGDKYDYSLTEYVNAMTKLKIVCHSLDENGTEHGVFEQTPNHHLRGSGCPKCGYIVIGNKKRLDTQSFIEKAKVIHNDFYDYTDTTYKSSSEYVEIGCPVHGKFKQIAYYHLYGNGCSKCSMSQLEKKSMNYFIQNNIEFEYKKHFEWLKNKSYMELDFYLPKYNIGIECQGIQHFMYSTFGSKTDNYEVFETQIERDKLKLDLCNRNSVKLYYINYDVKDINSELDKIINKIKEEYAKQEPTATKVLRTC